MKYASFLTTFIKLEPHGVLTAFRSLKIFYILYIQYITYILNSRLSLFD